MILACQTAKRDATDEGPTILDESTLDLLTEVGLLVGSLGDEEAKEWPRHYLEIFALFDRCRSLFAAVRLLLRHGFAHEAVILTRPLFTDSLALEELASADKKRRGELILGMELSGLAGVEGIFHEIQSRGSDHSDDLAKLTEKRAEVEAYAARHGFGTSHWQPDNDAKRLAEKHHRGEHYSALRVSHHFVHGTTLATSQRYRKIGEYEVEVGGPAANLRVWANDAATFSAESLLRAGLAACLIFGWEAPVEFKTLFDRLEKEDERLKSGKSDSEAGLA